MRQIADLHIHSKYSRACSRDLTLENIDATCRTKGIDIIATGDFTYPAWFREIKKKLVEINSTGLYKLKTASDDKVKFLLATEVALIYKKDERCRRIHLMLNAPNLEAAEKLNKYLDKHFNIRSDGRPILGMSCEQLIKLCLSIHPKFLIYPAHIWTPWFGMFGSKSGFDSLEACFGEYSSDIFTYESGLSSDPEMNWRLSALDRLTLLSSSDAHSLPNIAREATVFDLENPSYDEIYQTLKTKNLNKIKFTIEFYPEEGIYFADGHLNCGVCLDLKKSAKQKGICPVCKKELTLGVNNRVNKLADREVGYTCPNSPDFIKLVELDKIIAESFKIKSRKSKKVQAEYTKIISHFGTEMNVLLEASSSDLRKVTTPLISRGVERARMGHLKVIPGYDGQYGQIKIFTEKELNP